MVLLVSMMETKNVMLVACCWEVDNMLLVLDPVRGIPTRDIHDIADVLLSNNSLVLHISNSLNIIYPCPVCADTYIDNYISAVMAVLLAVLLASASRCGQTERE